MDEQYSWKRTEEIEIDLADLLRCLCRQWKRIAVCALTSAVLLGGYGWLKGRDAPSVSIPDAAKEAVLTEAEQQAVTDAIRLEHEIRQLETYLDQSILMQLDPYHKAKYIMLYRIDHAERQELAAVTESYLNFVLNGGAADALAQSAGKWEMDKSYLAEVLSAYQKTYSSPYQVVVDDAADSSMFSEALFYVEVTGSNAREAEKMALDLQDVLKKYSASIKKTAGSHRLSLINSAESITADSGLQSQQHDKNNLLSSNRANLRTMTDAFSSGQMEVYQKTVDEEAENEKKESGESVLSQNTSEKSGVNTSDETVSNDKSGSVMKYIFLGLMGGIFAYCLVFSCRYIFRDTVKSMDEMKRLYVFPVYGGIALDGSNGKSRRSGTGTSRSSYRQTEAQVQNRIRLTCKKQGITKLYAASDIPLGVPEKECLERMAEQLKNWGIELSVAESVSADTAVWDDLAETGNVLIVCRMGTTTHRMIDHVMSFYLENGIAVAGAVAFLQSGS